MDGKNSDSFELVSTPVAISNRGDGIMEMMLKPTLATYESKDDKSKKSDDEDDD